MNSVNRRLPSWNISLDLRHGWWDCMIWCKTSWQTLRTWSERSSLNTSRKSRLITKSRKQEPMASLSFLEAETMRIMRMMIDQSTTQRIFLWDGMVSRSHTGSTNCMALVWSSSVKFVEVQVTGEGEPSRSISRNGDTLTAWSAWRYPTQSISKTWQRSNMLLDFTKRFSRRISRALSNLISKKSLKMRTAICIRESSTSISRGKGSFRARNLDTFSDF